MSYPYGSSSSPGRVGSYANNNGVGGGAGFGGSTSTGMVGNPYAVPSINPFLNPYASDVCAGVSHERRALFRRGPAEHGGDRFGADQQRAAGTRLVPRPESDPRRSTRQRHSRGRCGQLLPSEAEAGGMPSRHYNRYGNYYSANGH